ncbi:RES family NAD+ phosphorylase [Rhizobium straminoryzae]|uniref:RES domain-containing protein n=1 Tax=Rhizobium straminoryzae TaxID=1387186 RepID=A0A549TG10_9HYPH|nr:RES family NAD+ phosphorylase [Rhizobium straminoryzae]TRL41546.1 RES domain-containing protein [Rhizobium straminoryzae]
MPLFAHSHLEKVERSGDLVRISGLFFRSVPSDHADQVLTPPVSDKAGRYHRPGQPILYTSATLDWSIIAVSGYMRDDNRPRVVVPLRIDDALVLDQHDEGACLRLGIDRDLSNESWTRALAEGREPGSWRNADKARACGADGLVDRSRMIPGGWHLNLFRWNDLGGPKVTVCGGPIDIKLSSGGAKWGL